MYLYIRLYIIDQSKRIRGIYNGTLQLETEQMIKDIDELVEEFGNPNGNKVKPN